MKISVITMHAVKNYGSVLQTYATQKLLTDLGHDVEIVNYIRNKNLNSNLLKTWTKDDKGIKKKIKSLILKPTIRSWKKIFGEYLDEYINLTPYVYSSEEDLINNPPIADIFCTGSDQVWNSGWNNGIEKAFYLTFVPDNIPKIAIAASIGKNKLDKEEIDIILPYLRRYDYISMREISGLNIIRDMGLTNVGFCLDPTLLISKEEWLEHAKYPPMRKKYILVYQLNHDKEFDDYAVRLAKRKGLELYRVCTRYDQCRFSGKPIFIPKVQELLGLINNAEFIITNSFHATIFCINLNKEFISIYPNEYSSRISDILDVFSLQDRHLTNYNQYEIIDSKIDYKKVNLKLCEYRLQSINLIRNMIENSINKN